MPIFLPEKCLRNRDDCQPLGQIESDCGQSFICCGRNDGSDRSLAQDRFTLCWKNDEIDDRSHWDERDLLDTISVIAQALSADQNDEEIQKASYLRISNSETAPKT